MWIRPERISAKYDAELLGSNELFDKLRWKQNILFGVVSRLTRGPFRIHLRVAVNATYIVAIGDSLLDIEPQWNIIEEELLPSIRKNNANDSRREICEFLIVKCDSFARVQHIEKEEQECASFNELFGFMDEKLVSTYQCTLWKRTPVVLYLSGNYICIDYEEQEDQTISVRWKDISSIRKRRMLGRDVAINVEYMQKGKESKDFFLYGFTNRDEVAGVMDQLWQHIMKKILRSAENNSSLIEHSSHRRNSTTPSLIRDVSDRESLENLHTHSTYNQHFRLPLDELHLLEFPCKIWEGRGFKVGQLHISKHFLCYQTRKKRDIRVVIPFREMKSANKQDNLLGAKDKAIKVEDRHRRYMFIFESKSDRNKVFNKIVDKWNRALGECDLLSFTTVPLTKSGPIGMGELLHNENHFNKEYDETQEKLKIEWDLYVKKHGIKTGMAEDIPQLFSLLKQGGIADIHRSWAWPLFSGANYKSHCTPHLGYFQSLLDKEIDEDVLEEIQKDIGRSFPEHEFFQSEKGLDSLETVLRAYAVRNPVIGYCQSMNMITALLLVYLPDEWAFWVLASICEDLAPENYGQHMIGSIVDQSTFEELLGRSLPKLYNHLRNLDVQIGMITQGWFICLFIGYLPLEISLQILDMFFFLRGTMLYAVGLAVFKCFESKILTMFEADEIVVFLRNLEFCPDLLKTAYKYLETLDNESIKEIKNAGKFEVIKAMEKNSKESAVRVVQESGTKFELPELHQIFSVFRQVVSPETFVADQEEFSQILVHLIPWIKWREDLFRPLFMFDNDDGNSLGFVEVVSALSNACKGNLRERLTFYFTLHCTSGDGLVDEGDYYRALDAVIRSYNNEELYESDLRTLVHWTFLEADKDKNGRVFLSDICTLLLPTVVPGGNMSEKEESDAQFGLLSDLLREERCLA